MQIDKSTVTEALRAEGAYDRAQQAACVLPRRVDTERDAALLNRLDVPVGRLEGLQPAAVPSA